MKNLLDQGTTTLSGTARLLKWCFLAYLAVLPMSGTIALRNLLLVILVGAVVVDLAVALKAGRLSLARGMAHAPWPLLLWVLYLMSFPFVAVQPEVAWQNLRGQWGESILAWLVGYGVVRLLGRQGPSMWLLGMASAFPLALHLTLGLLAWAGLFGDNYFALDTLGAFGRALLSQAASGFAALGTPRDFPLGFRGVEPMHGNLGYAASQATILFGVCFALAWRERNQKQAYLATLSIAMCFASVLVAYSRGSLLFSAVVLLAMTAIYHFKWGRVEARQPISLPWLMGVLGVICLLLVVGYQAVRHDPRWQSMVDKVEVGLMIEHPADVLCNGVPASVEADIRHRLQDRGPAYADDVLNGLKGQDGGRILLMRVGLDLALAHPRGLDGSRQAYLKLMGEKCGHVPRLYFAHSHQSWIDLTLALGWMGALLFAGVLLYFMREGWLNMPTSGIEGWATVVFLLGFFWAIRGVADSVYREHYLQMQAVLIAYAYSRMRLVTSGAAR